MPDFDLAELYEVETRALKQAVKRNSSRFPEDFMFVLTSYEFSALRSQIVISKRGGTRYMPFAFTEHGVTMLTSTLNSEKAVKMNIAIVRAFTAMRAFVMSYQELADKLNALEDRYDARFADIYEALNLLLQDRQGQADWQERERIGFKK